jgi:hypothetical protein
MNSDLFQAYSNRATLLRESGPIEMIYENKLYNPFFLITRWYHLALSFRVRFWVS